LRLVITLDDASVLVAVTHLHHVPADEGLRDDQARQLMEWLDASPPTDAQIVVGDFNAEPSEPAVERIRSSGFRSAYAEANGADPEVTWPSGLQAPGMDTDGEPGCLDYVWIRGAVRVARARLAWDRPAVGDPTLYASDHIGLVAELSVRDGG
jgi:endonuclease/exonuclease/phosphatase family metal-dependent hydrolase